MNKTVEQLLEACRDFYDATHLYSSNSLCDEYHRFKKVIAELLNKRRWETPKQYEERTGEKWPDNGAVYCRYNYPNTEWTAWEATSYEWAKSSLWEKQIVITTESGPPPDDWKPEEMK